MGLAVSMYCGDGAGSGIESGLHMCDGAGSGIESGICATLLQWNLHNMKTHWWKLACM